RLYDGVRELLTQPPDLRAVLTNKPGDFARQILRGLGVLGAFQAVVGGDEAPRKPDPAGVLSLCGRLGVAPDETLYAGDSRVDAETARAAGIPLCGVLWGLGSGADLAGADYLCATPADLLKLLTLSLPRAT